MLRINALPRLRNQKLCTMNKQLRAREGRLSVRIKSLRYFIEIAKAGSFYRASKNLFISQQGLNKLITTLESELGVRLIERSREGIKLTASGNVLFGHAEKILAEYDATVVDLFGQQHASGQNDEPLTVYTTYYPMQLAASEVIDNAILNDILLIEEPFAKAIERAAQSDGSTLFLIDLYPDSQKLLLSRKDIRFEPIIKTRYGIVCRKDSPFASRRSLHRSELANIPIACNTQKEMAMLCDKLFESTPLRNVRLSATSPRMLLEFVQSTPGAVATFDSLGFYFSKKDSSMLTDNLCFVPLSTEASVCYLGYLRGRKNDPSIHVQYAEATFKRFLADQFSDYFKKYPIE